MAFRYGKVSFGCRSQALFDTVWNCWGLGFWIQAQGIGPLGLSWQRRKIHRSRIFRDGAWSEAWCILCLVLCFNMLYFVKCRLFLMKVKRGGFILLNQLTFPDPSDNSNGGNGSGSSKRNPISWLEGATEQMNYRIELMEKLYINNDRKLWALIGIGIATLLTLFGAVITLLIKFSQFTIIGDKL